MTDSYAGLAPDLPANLGIERIDHVGIAVADLATAESLYTELLGMKISYREVNREQGVTEVMLTPGEKTTDGDRSIAGTQIQLLHALSAESAVGRFVTNRGPGLHHVAYRVSDLEGATRALEALGVRLLYNSSKAGTGGSRINFVHPKDAGGVLIELVEAVADRN